MNHPLPSPASRSRGVLLLLTTLAPLAASCEFASPSPATSSWTEPLHGPGAAAFDGAASNRAVRVELPARASLPMTLARADGRARIEVELHGATAATPLLEDGRARYPAALPGDADLIRRAHAEGVEDDVLYPRRPEREELRYTMHLGTTAGLRLVGNTLELLDEGGAPRLRVRPPFLVDARGDRRRAFLDVPDCAVDRDPRAPWGRPPTAPGRSTCELSVTWGEAAGDGQIAYPATLDPDWVTTGSMSVARNDHTATLLSNGQVLVAGGYEISQATASSELFDPVTGTWAMTGDLLHIRSGHAAVELSADQVLAMGGYYQTPSLGPESLASCELYDAATGSWSPAQEMGQSRSHPSAERLTSGAILIAGGTHIVAGQTGIAEASAEIYDPSTAAWGPTGAMQTPRRTYASVLLADGRVLVAGGRGSPAVLASTEVYDPGTGTFTAAADMAEARAGHAAVLLTTGRVLVMGGDTGVDIVKTAELFDPATGSWSATGSMLIPRYLHTATRLLDGRVLVAGGFYETDAKPFVLPQATSLYDPATGTWMPAGLPNGAMVQGRYWHAAARLADGRVLATGGSISLSVKTATAELYAPEPIEKFPGQACLADSECLSRACVDGVCCDQSCGGGAEDDCLACSKAAGASADGVCEELDTPECQSTSAGGGGSGGTGTTTTTGGEGPGGEGGGGGGGALLDSDTGCGCRTSAPAPGGAWLSLVGIAASLLGLSRRGGRRRRAR